MLSSPRPDIIERLQLAARGDARDDVIGYIARFYNSRRKHSYLGYVSPNEYEKIVHVA
jgi:putative transposase